VAEPASDAPGPRPLGRRVRKSSEARRAQLLDATYEVLAAGGPASGGMADVAATAGVSPGLLYHYFPAGRAELVDALARRLLDDLCERLEAAASLPFSPLGRVEQALAALVGHLVDHPVAYRLLFDGTGTDVDAELARLARVRLVTLLTTRLADAARPADELVDAGTNLLDRVLADVGRCLAGELEPEAAWRSGCRRARRAFS
jgi:AcrR family transcriptional regulator